MAGFEGDGSIRLATLAGEILGAAGWRDALCLAPSATAAEMATALVDRDGPAALARLEGVWAFADGTRRPPLFACDPSGLQPLYLDVAGPAPGTWAFRLDDLCRDTRARRLYRPALHEYLRHLEVAPPRTWLEGVVCVEPGQAWLAKPGSRPVVEPLSGPDLGPMPADFGSALDALEARLSAAVERSLEGAARPAVFLSGGVDSALLCALAVRRRPDLTAVTVGFDVGPFDETGDAARIAAHLGLRHEVLRFDHADCLAAFERLATQADQPLADPAGMVSLLAFERCAARFDVVLDGTGADEAVGLMPPRHTRIAVAQAARLPRPVRRAVVQLLRAAPALGAYAPVFDFEHPADVLSRWRGFRQTEIEALCGAPVSLEDTRFRRTFDRHPRHADFERYSELLNAMTCDRVAQARAISGAALRFPFWDGAVQALLRRLPVGWRWQPGRPKHVLRSLLARHLPPALWDRPKHGFDFPLQEFLSRNDFALVRRHASASRWQTLGLLDPERVQAWADRFVAGDEQATFRVWALVVLSAWLEPRAAKLDLRP